ncbi:hypothetical protein [Streptomyces sp. 6N106]
MSTSALRLAVLSADPEDDSPDTDAPTPGGQTPGDSDDGRQYNRSRG